MQYAFPSEILTWQTGGKGHFQLDGFLPNRLGPRGGRLVVEQVHIKATLNLTTGGGVTLAAADQATFIKRLLLKDAAGVRRDISGFKVRTKAFLDMGSEVPPDPAAFGAGTTADATFDYWINFANPKARRKYDYAIPVDDLRSGIMQLQYPANSDLHAAGGTPTINSGTYQATAFCREEWDGEFHVRDVVEEHASSSNTDLYIEGNGRLVREAVIVKEAAGGGSSLTNITDVSVTPLQMVQVARRSLKLGYLTQRPVTTSVDPTYNDKLLPVIYPRADAKITDFPLVGGRMLVKLTSSVATPDLMVHYIAPRDERQMAIAASMMGLQGHFDLEAKTAGKTQRDLKAWGPLRAFVSVKAVR